MKIIGIDNQEEIQRQIKIKKMLITIIISIILIVSLVVILFYIGNKKCRDFIDKYVLMKNVNENQLDFISLEQYQNSEIYAYDKYISIFNKNTLDGYNSSGKKEYELTLEITSPLVDTNNRFLLVAEKQGQKIYLISGDTIIWTKQLEGNISRISVNKNGYVSVVLTGTIHKSVIQVFDSHGEEMFKTYLSNSIAMDTDISYDNKYLSFAEVSTSGTLLQCMIKTISIPKAQETPSEAIISTITCPNNSTVLNLKYQDGNKLTCMYDNSICVIQNENSELLLDMQEDGKKITFADIELSNYAFEIIEKSSLISSETTVKLINVGNKKINEYKLDGIIKEIYDYDDIVALNLGSEVHFIGTNGWLIKKYTSSQEIRKIVINSNFAGIVYRDKIEIVNL